MSDKAVRKAYRILYNEIHDNKKFSTALFNRIRKFYPEDRKVIRDLYNEVKFLIIEEFKSKRIPVEAIEIIATPKNRHRQLKTLVRLVKKFADLSKFEVDLIRTDLAFERFSKGFKARSLSSPSVSDVPEPKDEAIVKAQIAELKATGEWNPKARRKLLLKWHPDKAPAGLEKEYTEVSKIITGAGSKRRKARK